jgi:cytochrome c-type biogenesis protein
MMFMLINSLRAVFAVTIALSATACSTNSGNSEAADNLTVSNPPVEQTTQTASTMGDSLDLSSVNVGRITNVSEATAEMTAPDFSWVDSDGNVRSLSDFRGKVVMVNFWGTWCPPCRAELPDLVRVQDDFADNGLVVIGVSLERAAEAQVPSILNEFASANDLRYPLVWAQRDNMIELVTAYGGVEAVPTTFIVDANGRIVNTLVGMQSEEQFRSVVEPLMGSSEQM